MRKIIHIDMDCFYAAIEMRDNPSLRNIPLAIGGRADRRGVICTANYMARRYGVHSAMSTALALKHCPQLRIIPGRMSLYKEISWQIRQILLDFTQLVEPISLDEAYLDVTNSSHYHGSATLIANAIRQRIFNQLSLTASAGIAPVKFLAKIASDMNKPNGQYVITPDQVANFIYPLLLRKIPGVGKVTAQRLQKMGLETCGDIQQFDLITLVKELGKFGQILWDLSHGVDPRSINSERLPKSVGVERTVAKDIYQWDDCMKIIERLYPELETRLAKIKPELSIASQGVKMKFTDFQLTTQEHSYPILSKGELIQIAQQIWQQRRADRGVRLVGLHITLQNPQIEKQLILNW